MGKLEDVPSSFENVISVGGTDHEKNKSDLSNYGNKTYDILGPAGSTVYLIDFRLMNFINKKMYINDWIFVATPNDSYQYLYGNSFAALHVAGTLALIIDKYGYQEKPQKAIQHLKQNSKKLNKNIYLNAEMALTP